MPSGLYRVKANTSFSNVLMQATAVMYTPLMPCTSAPLLVTESIEVEASTPTVAVMASELRGSQRESRTTRDGGSSASLIFEIAFTAATACARSCQAHQSSR